VPCSQKRNWRPPSTRQVAAGRSHYQYQCRSTSSTLALYPLLWPRQVLNWRAQQMSDHCGRRKTMAAPNAYTFRVRCHRPSVLAVGAMNWEQKNRSLSATGGKATRSRASWRQARTSMAPCLLAELVRATGTSFATANSLGPSPHSSCRFRSNVENRLIAQAVRLAILGSAHALFPFPAARDCERLLAGRLNVEGAIFVLTRTRGATMQQTRVGLQGRSSIGRTSSRCRAGRTLCSK